MQLEKQVCSLELAKKLKELGAKQESLFYHIHSDNGKYGKMWAISYGAADLKRDIRFIENVSAFTCGELGEMLPKHYASLRRIIEGGKEIYICWNTDEPDYTNSTFADTEADCRSKMLVYLLENGLIK